jgi:hypothetical protein
MRELIWLSIILMNKLLKEDKDFTIDQDQMSQKLFKINLMKTLNYF